MLLMPLEALSRLLLLLLLSLILQGICLPLPLAAPGPDVWWTLWGACNLAITAFTKLRVKESKGAAVCAI